MRQSSFQELSAARRFLSTGNSCECPSVRFNGFRNRLTVNKLPFAAAGDESGFAENFQVMRNGRRRDAAHGNDFPTVHVLAGGNSFENSETGLVGKGFGYFLDLGAVHGP